MKFNFLTDLPLRNDELNKAKYGHPEISDVLFNIISKCKTPFTIALCGKWGTGKSSIANAAIEKIKNSNDIAVVFFDVWKYEGDELRRSFLIEAVKQLQQEDVKVLPKDFKLNDRLDNSVTTTSTGELKLHWAKIKQFKTPFIIGLVFLIVLVVAFSTVGFLQTFWDTIKNFVLAIGAVFGVTGLSTCVVLFLVKFIPELITTETKTYATDRFKDPHEFEEEFRRVLRQINVQRLVVVFDNLDRVIQSKALELLLTIKTFLEPVDEEVDDKEVVFLIPCDIEAIKKHVKNIYSPNGGGEFDDDEFLRKFFNVKVIIPDFINTELENSAKEYLQGTEISDLNNDEIAWMISKEFRENPRQIKQFINNLLAAYLVLKSRLDNEKIKECKITPVSLTKYLIIETKYSNILKGLLKNNVWNLQTINKDEIIKLLNNDKNEEDINKLYQYLQDTNHIEINNLYIYSTLRYSEEEQNIPGSSDFIIALKDKDDERARSIMEKIQNTPNYTDNFMSIVGLAWTNTSNVVSKLNIIKTLLPLLKDSGVSVSKNIANDFATFLSNQHNWRLKEIDPALVFDLILGAIKNGSNVNLVVDKYVQILEKQGSVEGGDQLSPDYKNKIISEVSRHTSWFNGKEQRLRSVLEEFYTEKLDIIELFSKDNNIQDNYISPKFLLSYIKKITFNDLDLLPNKQESNLLIKFNNLNLLQSKFFTAVVSRELVRILTIILDNENNNHPNPKEDNRLDTRMSAINLMDSFFIRFSKQFILIKNDEIWKNFVNSLNQGIEQVSNKIDYISLFFAIFEFIDGENKSIVKSKIDEFINNANIENLKYLYGKNNSWIDKNLAFYENFKTKAVKDRDVFVWMYGEIKSDEKEQLIKETISSGVTTFLNSYEDIKSRIFNNAELVDILLEKVKVLKTPANISKIYDICNELKCADNDDLCYKYSEHLADNLQSDNEDFQITARYGFDNAIYLDNTLKIRTLKKVIDYLKDSENPLQKSNIEMVTENWGLISEITYQKLFIEFVFNKLIDNDDKQKNEIGFGVLIKLKPSYDDYRTNFDSLKLKINRETNDIEKLKTCDKVLAIFDDNSKGGDKEFRDEIVKIRKDEENRKILTIVKALYGTDKKSFDVTDKVRSMIKDNILEITASNDIAGDPDENSVKNLKIIYIHNNTEKEVVIKEKETIKLPK